MVIGIAVAVIGLATFLGARWLSEMQRRQADWFLGKERTGPSTLWPPNLYRATGLAMAVIGIGSAITS